MNEQTKLSFFARLWLAFVCFWRVLVSGPFAQAVAPLSRAYDAGTLRNMRVSPALAPTPAAPKRAEVDDTVGPIKVMRREQLAPAGGAVSAAAPVVVAERRPEPEPVKPAPELKAVPPVPPPAPAPAPAPAPVAMSPEREHASALLVLAMLQREGRLIDFLQENVASFSDAEVGNAARIVHEGCRKFLSQYVSVEPVLKDAEGARVQVPPGFDAQRIRLTGNVAGQPPYAGALKHHGWVATAVRLPSPSAALDARVLAPAEVELA